MLKQLALIGVISFCSTVGFAQIKPKILIIFDTSGSMLTILPNSNYSDGSALCDNQGKDARIYQLKEAFMDVLQGMGAKEIDFALATFPMQLDPQRTPRCPGHDDCSGEPPYSCAGHYFVNAANDSEIEARRHACKISTHDPVTQQTANCATDACPWYEGFKNEVLKVPFTNTTPENVMIYFDEKEDTGSVSVLTNPEVRASSHWHTPLGKSLFYAHGYFNKEVVLPESSYLKPCERLAVALFTDGSETCNDSDTNPFYPITWAGNLNKDMGVVTHTVAMDETDILLKFIADAGKGNYYPVKGTTDDLKTAILDIIAKSQPPRELCNGQDDDCDNLIDEDFPLKGEPCHNNKPGECFRTGFYICSPDGSSLVCNAPDINGTEEVCNGKDDDCDGSIDEEIPGGCSIPVCQVEVCNGKDDDCDTKIDNDIPSQPCGPTIGECKPGMSDCIDGKVVCLNATGPTPEKCNGLDDDCDGVRDEIMETCYSFSSGCDLISGTCKGICKLGQRICKAEQNGEDWKGVWGTCKGEVGPAQEVCDGIDNDCDGNIDEQAECPGQTQCLNGQCVVACGSEELSCPQAHICRNGWCIPDTCDPAACEKSSPGWICRAGECVNPCEGVKCLSQYETCIRGVCQDTSCYATGCPTGENCIQGKCQTDPCVNVSCSPDEFCQAGSCILKCNLLECSLSETCQIVEEGGVRQSRCVKNPCASITCPEKQICFEGSCIDDPCLKVTCEKGQFCQNGLCIADWCELTRCPLGYVCNRGICEPENIIAASDMLAAGSGGFSCAAGGATQPQSSLPLFLFALIGLGWLTRRKSIR